MKAFNIFDAFQIHINKELYFTVQNPIGRVKLINFWKKI